MIYHDAAAKEKDERQVLEALNSEINEVDDLVSIAAAASNHLSSIDPAIGLDNQTGGHNGRVDHYHNRVHDGHSQGSGSDSNGQMIHDGTAADGASTTSPSRKEKSSNSGNNAPTKIKSQLLEDKHQNFEGQDGGDIDPKKFCTFCGKSFSHPGSLGRHLDLKRGSRQHPADQVDKIRGDVKRRGDIAEIKSRRAKRAKIYNSREDVKERAKIRRKEKEKSDRAREIAKTNFISRIGAPSLPPHPSFAHVVLYFLPPSHWPHDPPTKQTFDSLEAALEKLAGNDENYESFKTRLEVAFDQWSRMNKQTKIDIWVREQRRAAEAALCQISLYDLGSRDRWLDVEQQRVMEEIDRDPDGNDE